jgi:hypothetical protein
LRRRPDPLVILEGTDKASQAIGQKREPNEGDLLLIEVVASSLKVEETPGLGRIVPESDEGQVEQVTIRVAAQGSTILNRELTTIGEEGVSMT